MEKAMSQAQTEVEEVRSGISQSMMDRAVSDEIASTRRIERLDSSARRRKQECAEVKERFAINLTALVDHDDYARLAANHLRVGTRRSELDKELRDTITSLARGMAAYNKHKIEHQAQAIIDGEDGATFQGFEELRGRQVRLENEVRAHVKAQGQIWAEMETTRSERSIDAAEAARPAHKSVAAIIADACATLQKALRDEARIRDIVTDAGFDNRLPNLQGISDLAELESRAREYAR